MNENNPLATVYFLRHQQSVQNAQGHGEKDTDLTKEGRKSATDLARVINNIGAENIDEVICGTLKKHTQTFEVLNNEVDYQGIVTPDARANTIFSGPLIENPAEITEKDEKLNLKRFQVPKGEKYTAIIDEIKIGFDPRKAGIFPFDPLYCEAYLDRDLRKIVFPNNPTLVSFKQIEENISSFQTDIIKRTNNASKPLNIIVVSSCSPNGFNLEYGEFGTIGKHIYDNFGSENKPIFPQNHNEIMVLGYNQKAKEEGRTRLQAIEGNVTIENYLKNETIQNSRG